jgi:hypothetical protein
MNEDYLWDKSGKPDPQVQELEEILSALRYEPRPLEIPKELAVVRRRSYVPILTIAATVALSLLAAGLWLRVQSQKNPTSSVVETKPSVAPSGIGKDVPTTVVVKNGSLDQRPKEVSVPINHRNSSRNLFAANIRRVKNPRETGLKPGERQEALVAKEQLMMALRLASEKLNLAQRRTQLSSPANLIRNQHKVG